MHFVRHDGVDDHGVNMQVEDLNVMDYILVDALAMRLMLLVMINHHWHKLPV